METAFEEEPVGLAALDAVHVVNPPDRPGVNRRIQVGELPLISRDLAVRMLKLLEQEQPELFLGIARIDQGKGHTLKCQVPRREPRILPLVGNGHDAH